MKWPWQRHREQLERARREQADIERRGREREPMLHRVEEKGGPNGFAERWKRALGGTP